MVLPSRERRNPLTLPLKADFLRCRHRRQRLSEVHLLVLLVTVHSNPFQQSRPNPPATRCFDTQAFSALPVVHGWLLGSETPHRPTAPGPGAYTVQVDGRQRMFGISSPFVINFCPCTITCSPGEPDHRGRTPNGQFLSMSTALTDRKASTLVRRRPDLFPENTSPRSFSGEHSVDLTVFS